MLLTRWPITIETSSVKPFLRASHSHSLQAPSDLAWGDKWLPVALLLLIYKKENQGLESLDRNHSCLGREQQPQVESPSFNVTQACTGLA